MMKCITSIVVEIIYTLHPSSRRQHLSDSNYPVRKNLQYAILSGGPCGNKVETVLIVYSLGMLATFNLFIENMHRSVQYVDKLQKKNPQRFWLFSSIFSINKFIIHKRREISLYVCCYGLVFFFFFRLSVFRQ